MTVPSPLTSPKKASHFSQIPSRVSSFSEAKGPTASKNNGHWSNGGEENTLARTQQFIIETYKNPIHFKLSDAPISAEVPYLPINDSNLLSSKKSSGQVSSSSLKSSLKDGTLGTLPRVYTTTPTTESQGDTKVATEGSMASSSKDLFIPRISLHPPKEANERGVGLNNKGNTCYMNSTLQALLHLPPLSHALLSYDENQLYGRMGGTPVHKFDALGEMRSLAQRVLTKSSGGSSQTPGTFIANLKSYARTLSKYRQEDAHEFLRFLLDAMQYCCVLRAPKSLKPNDPLRETTVIHKIFGGKLRSRVQCQRCKYNSDTFDPILDLSLDLRKSSSVHEALEKFTSVDVLTGSEKYKCEKCKKAVDATKGFTIHEPPLVLTVHLKRFNLAGQKINRPINYPDSLVLTKTMLSEGLSPQHYKLRSIVHHHGSGPNSGHYVASVKGNGSNRWYEMNDSVVYPTRATPINISDAYILFYVRDPGQALTTVVRTESMLGNKRRLSDAGTMDANERRSKKREDASPVSLLRKKSLQSEGKSAAVSSSPSSSSYIARSEASARGDKSQKSPMFRNMDTADSDDDEGGNDDDDVGEPIESQSTHKIRAAPISPHLSGKSKKKKGHHHLSNLGLGIKAANQSKSKLVGSPFQVGQNTIRKAQPFYSRMKDRNGNRPF
ncbi:hypothetical protein CBS101457_000974 [Exobasidium rhododendri]|nr:hypothetical protein CBS101457_000974 [Exobasidium rhododendri]